MGFKIKGIAYGEKKVHYNKMVYSSPSHESVFKTLLGEQPRQKENLHIKYSEENPFKVESHKDYRKHMGSVFYKSLKKQLRKREEYQSCRYCGGNSALEFHHLSYAHLRTPKEGNDLIVLCRRWHNSLHKLLILNGYPTEYGSRLLLSFKIKQT